MGDGTKVGWPLERMARMGEALVREGWKLASVETASGGLFSYMAVSIPGASRWFVGSVVAYGPLMKSIALGVDPALFDPHGVVSASGAELMSTSLRDMLGCQLVIAETSVAEKRPGARSRKPSGLCHLSLSTPDGTVPREFVFRGGREAVMARISMAMVDMVATYVEHSFIGIMLGTEDEEETAG